MKRIILLCICSIFFFEVASGQALLGGPPLPRVDFLSPQTYEFVKHGSIPISHFTGQADIKIPIYNYSDADFNIPIFLSYNATGFEPGKREGIVGLNWFINSGAGVITRQVNGRPDEKIGSRESEIKTSHGYYYCIKNQLSITNMTQSELFDPNNGEVITESVWLIDECEVFPDDFTFSVPGHSGRFFIDHTGEVKTSGNKPFKVDLSGFSLQDAGIASEVNPSTIVVTTDDGYTYTFGGTIQHLEVSYNINDQLALLEPDGYPIINAWHLTEIKAPNGRTVTYQYEPFIEEFFPTRPLEDPKHYLLNAYRIGYADILTQYLHLSNGFVRYKSSTMNDQHGVITSRSLTKTVYLKTIIVDNTTIEFLYNEKAKEFYDDEVFFNQKTLKLSDIRVKYNGEDFKQFNFRYDYYGGANSRLFLTAFQEVGVLSSGYNFYYHKVDPHVSTQTISLPKPKTHAVDHWGYWNNDAENSPLIPETDIDEVTADVNYLTAERQPDISKCDVALLYKIVYPTGGYTEFSYERHEYNRRLERRSPTFLPVLYEVSGFAGGARISRIVDYDGEKLINHRDFLYKNDFATGGSESSGILLSWPRYVVYYKYADNSDPNHLDNRWFTKKNSSTLSANHSTLENFIHYSEVTEVIKPSNGFINYKFQNYRFHADRQDNLQTPVDTESQEHTVHLASFNNLPGQRLNDRSIERGLPYEVTTFASKPDGTFYAVQKTETIYSTYSDYPNQYTVGVMQTGGIAHSYKQYYYAVLPKVVTETVYSREGINSTSSTTRFTYNSTNYPLKQTVFMSDGTTKSTEFRYPLDLVNESDHLFVTGTNPTSLYTSLSQEVKPIVDLKLNNIINKPIEIIKYQNDMVIKASYIEHKDFANAQFSKKVFPSKLWTLKTNSSLPVFSEFFLTTSYSLGAKVSFCGLVYQSLENNNQGNSPATSANKWSIVNPPYFCKASICKTGTWSFIKDDSYDPGYDPNNPEDAPDPDVSFDMYDDKGHLLQMTNRGSLTNSYQWGYNSMYPIAEIIGSAWDQFIYEGFEENGNDSNAKAGRKSKSGGYSRTFGNLSPGTYILSYWQKQTNNTWTFVPLELSVSTNPYELTIGNEVHLDELRFYQKLPLVRMSTYTYDPLVGMTSKTDANNKFEFFEYYPDGRLKLLRDDLRNIVKKYEYSYQLR